MFDVLLPQAFAQAAPAQQPNPLMSFLPLIIIFVIFYFLMIRPQKKKIQEEEKMLQALSKGDEVFTKSGVFGTIQGINDHIVTLEIAEGVKVKFLKGQIGGLAKNLLGKKA